MNLADWAEDTARSILQTPLPRRWAHRQGVAAQARTLEVILGKDADLLVAAAWLHDIGYAPDLVDTGFHPLDGARYLGDPASQRHALPAGSAPLLRHDRGHSARSGRPVAPGVRASAVTWPTR